MVLRPFNLEELKEIFDETSIQVLEFFMRKAMFSQPERIIGQDILPIQVPKEHLEQWVVQAIGALPVGAGNYGVDVIKEGEFGADIKMLSCKISKNGNLTDSESGETSLAQNFKDTGDSLDTMFENKRFDEIVDGWKEIIYNKLNKVKEEQNVENIYYIFILRAGTTFRLCAMEVDTDKLKDIGVGKVTSTSVFINNFIDENYGSVKIYKSKKRIELRLRPKFWVDNNMTIDFELKSNSEPVNIRELVENKEIYEYQEKIIKDIFPSLVNV